MRKELTEHCCTKVDNELHKDFVEIMFYNINKTTPFMILFGQEQKKLLCKRGSGVRYHPMIVRFCLSLLSKSPSAKSNPT